jgi:DNA-directed RNA polymerase subunit RPC12/RpoP
MKKFQKNNQTFVCINCKEQVPPHPTSSRDHCSYCLFGLHVDLNPGDRANNCKGVLEPIGVETLNQKERIVYRCKKCNELIKNITAPDDNRKMITDLYQKSWQNP